MKFKDLVIYGEHIDLRIIKPEDKAVYFKAGFEEADKELDYYTGTKTAYSKESVYSYVNRIVDDESRYDFLILDKSNNILGEVVLNEIEEESRQANFRICLFNSTLCGKGYGTLAARMLMEFAFETVKLHRVELEVFSFNTRAQKSYKKVGFVEEGIKRDGEIIDGKYCDVIIMSMLESDYKALQDI